MYFSMSVRVFDSTLNIVYVEDVAPAFICAGSVVDLLKFPPRIKFQGYRRRPRSPLSVRRPMMIFLHLRLL